MSILSLDQYLKGFFEKEKIFLLQMYPGLNLHRLRIELKQHAFLNGVDCEELFDWPYLPHKTNPISIFFEKLLEGTPLEYITGYAYFYRSNFKVTKDVLIPRSETEILVELASQEIRKKFKYKKCRVVDVGTGSGIMALSILMEGGAIIDMVATDISEKALAIAKENYFNQQYAIGKEHSIRFIKADRLEGVDGMFDFILSNPPYIKRSGDSIGVHEQVNQFEPHIALYLNDETYESWFADFFHSMFSKLNKDGIVLMEGHEDHLEQLAALALTHGFKTAQVIKDYTQRNRFLKLTN